MDRKYFSMNSIARNKWVYAKKIALSVLFGSLAFFVLNACFYIPYAHAEEHADALNTSSVETAPSHPDNGWDSTRNITTRMDSKYVPRKYMMRKKKTGIG